MKVYKYFNSRWKKKITKGFYHVNTFENIQSGEDGLINDSNEGIAKNLTDKNFTVTGGKPEDQRHIENLKPLGINIINGTLITNGSNINNVVPNAHMFCVTTVRNDNYWKNIPIDQGGPYDSCLEISNFEAFAVKLVKELGLGNWKIGECYHEDNTANLSNGDIKLADYFRKPDTKAFKEQKEIRMVFCPKVSLNLKPTTVRIKSKKLVKIIY